MLLVSTVILSIGLPQLAAAKSMGGPSKTTPENLPVTQATPQLVDDWAKEAKGNPHGTPPGQDKEKPPKDDDGDGANKWAVVIGIADYDGTENDLWHPDEDAREMSRALIRNHGFPRSHVRTLINSEATAQNIILAIAWLVASENTTSTVVFFFSGHGYRVSEVSANWDDDRESDSHDECIVSYDLYGLTDGLLKDLFSNIESTKFGLIFGSCHSGGMFDDNDDLQGAGRVLVSACEASELAWDYMLLGNTLFGYYFVDEGMLDKLADVREPSGVSIEEALEYSYPRVTAQQPDERPQISDNYSDELVP